MAKKKKGTPTPVLHIFGIKVPVYENAQQLQGSHIMGYYDLEQEAIYLQGVKEDYGTLIHEIGHAIFHRTGLKQAISGDVEEIVVENIATALMENFEVKLKIKK